MSVSSPWHCGQPLQPLQCPHSQSTELKNDSICTICPNIYLSSTYLVRVFQSRDTHLTWAIINYVFGHSLRRPLGFGIQGLLVDLPVEAGQLLLILPLALPATVRRLPRNVPPAEPQARARRSARGRALAPLPPLAPPAVH